MSRTAVVAILGICCTASGRSDDLAWLDAYKVQWSWPSKNAGASMPCAGGDIGLNVWVENGDLLFYIGRAGCRDENGALLKPGRVRVKFTPDPFENGKFRQELKLREGYVSVDGGFAEGAGLSMKRLIQYDIDARRTAIHDFGASVSPGEGVFAPAGADSAENEGFVIVMTHDADADQSELQILDAQNFAGDPVARVRMPQRVPFGFHANWVPDPV